MVKTTLKFLLPEHQGLGVVEGRVQAPVHGQEEAVDVDVDDAAVGQGVRVHSCDVAAFSGACGSARSGQEAPQK